MDKTQIAKKAVKIVVGISAAYVIGSILKNNVTTVTTTQKVQAHIGSYVLGAMLSEAVSDWTDYKIDETIVWWNNTVNKTPENV